MQLRIVALIAFVALSAIASARNPEWKPGAEDVNPQRARIETRVRQYEKLREAATRAKIANVDEFLKWLPSQSFPDEFKAEVRGKAALAIDAIDLAWGDVKRHSNDVLLANGLDDRSPIRDTIDALRRSSRGDEAKKLARRFAFRAEDDSPQVKAKSKRENALNNKLFDALDAKDDSLKIPRLSDGFGEASRIQYAVEWFCLAGDREAAEAVVKRLSSREKPTEKDIRREHRYLYRRVGDLQAERGDLDAAFKTHRLADELVKPGDWEHDPHGTLAWALHLKLGFEGAMERARGVSVDFEQDVLLSNPPQLPHDALLLKRREEAFWRLLPRQADVEKAKATAACFASEYVEQGDLPNAIRVMERALSSPLARCDADDAERLLLNKTCFQSPNESEKLAKALADLAKADAKMDAEDRAWLTLDLAIFHAKIGRIAEAKKLGEEARRRHGKDDVGRFELLDVLTGSPQSSWAKLDEWLKDNSWAIKQTFVKWDLPDEFFKELLRRVEAVKTSEEGPSVENKHEAIAAVASKLGMEARAKEALRGAFNENTRHSASLMRDCLLEEFGWELIRAMPFDNDRAARAAVAADLANDILRDFGIK